MRIKQPARLGSTARPPKKAWPFRGMWIFRRKSQLCRCCGTHRKYHHTIRCQRPPEGSNGLFVCGEYMMYREHGGDLNRLTLCSVCPKCKLPPYGEGTTIDRY